MILCEVFSLTLVAHNVVADNQLTVTDKPQDPPWQAYDSIPCANLKRSPDVHVEFNCTSAASKICKGCSLVTVRADGTNVGDAEEISRVYSTVVKPVNMNTGQSTSLTAETPCQRRAGNQDGLRRVVNQVSLATPNHS